jgi:hypothetical protein
MKLTALALATAAVTASFALAPSTAEARSSYSIGIGLGGPGYGYYPPVGYYPAPVMAPVYPHYHGCYYRPYPMAYPGWGGPALSFSYHRR